MKKKLRHNYCNHTLEPRPGYVDYLQKHTNFEAKCLWLDKPMYC